ncbi:hypothetical protein P3T76_012373 [Phytophthora citrophthora]|uniref:Rab-GAP TBC domain-containing protein n=1 Tax=Phytophthora citrophthora TaxID=4793 RepID=A0AAD9LEA5_9STRA|nr:hypothetical protein P3T76_012373 [Phytophthora citrophthora]
MGSSSSTTLFSFSENQYWEFTTSDRLLDQMEKQTHSAPSATWMETFASFFAFVLSTLAALLVGNLTGSLDHPQEKIFVDAACQTEDEYYRELTVNRDYHPCHYECKDDDSHSTTTEMTEDFTDTEFEGGFSDDDSEWESMGSEAQGVLNAICGACDSCVDCDCETQADQLLRLTAIVCNESDDRSPIYLEDYLCLCGECPHYQEIERDVAVVKTSQQQIQSITRLLQAFSTYNEQIGYRVDMISAARECLRIWCGDEDKAFKSFVTLYDEVPRLCSPMRSA